MRKESNRTYRSNDGEFFFFPYLFFFFQPVDIINSRHIMCKTELLSKFWV